MNRKTLDDVTLLDENDPLAPFRERFDIPDDLIYLDGNSLGCLPKAAKDRVNDVVAREWGQDLIRSWNSNDWINAPARIGDKIARLIGADDGEVIVGDSTSINVFKCLNACLQIDSTRKTLVTETGNFPTDAYMIEGLASIAPDRITARLVEPGNVVESLNETTAALLLTHTHYKTGRLRDMKAITAAAHAKGVPVIWDLSHSCGAMPVDLNGCNADFAIGCGYKYLNGGPGAPAFTFVARRHQEKVFPALSGWLGHKQPFAFDDRYTPAPGINRFQCGTPGIIGCAALEVGVDLMLEADMLALRQKSSALGDLFIQLVQEQCADFGFDPACPTNAAERGSQVSFHHPDGYAIMQALIARGVIGDFRAPDILRFGFAPLYISYVDVWNAVDILRDVMTSNEWDQALFKQKAAVT
ncbi:kynureninase [Hyphobacterium sp. CCMP332]|uniref:kynureninase n=1 Tax=Hyphobacterium sp. CCMP332 TaxID=2749086 RepID=UPI00164F91AD|nr:kynureninase [Hyphobacterium sp. CCMP332]QNL18731.1 kynureninase [Hyphobacterium sp. CCMP332]